MNNNHSNSDLNSNEERKRSSRNVLRQILEAEAQNTVEHQEVSGEQEVAANEGQQNQQQESATTEQQDTTTNTTKDTSNPSSKTQIAKRVESGNQLPIAASTPSSTISISNARTSSTSTSSRYAGSSRADSRAHFAMMQELRRMEDDDDDSKPASGTRTPTNSPETGSNDEASNHPPNIDTLPLLTPAQRRNQRVIQMRHAAMREAQHRTSRARNQLVPSGGGTVARVNPARRPVGGDRDFQRAVNRITTRLRLARQRLQSSVAVLRNLENRVTNADDSSSDSELEFDPPPHPPVVRRFRRGANGRQQARPVRGPRPIQAAMNAGIPNAPMNREMAARHRIKRQTMLQQHATPPVPSKRNDRQSFDWPEMARFLEQRRQPPEPVLQRSFSIVRQYRPGESPTNNRNVEGPSRQAYALPTNHRLRIPLEVKRQLRVHASGRPVANDAHPAASDYIFRPPYVIQQRTTIYRLRNLESPEEETEPETAIDTQATATDDEETQGEEITGEETKDDTGMESNDDRDSTAGDGSETSTDN